MATSGFKGLLLDGLLERQCSQGPMIMMMMKVALFHGHHYT